MIVNFNKIIIVSVAKNNNNSNYLIKKNRNYGKSIIHFMQRQIFTVFDLHSGQYKFKVAILSLLAVR